MRMDDSALPDDRVRSWTRGIAAGDPAAFAMFYEARFEVVLGLARRCARRDESFALDVVQETMLRVARSIPILDREAELDAWLFRAVRSSTIDLFRREARRLHRETTWARDRERRADSGHDASTALESDERLAWLDARVAELEDLDRSLIRARFFDGASTAEIGRLFGMTIHAVHGRLRRIVERLRSAARGISKELL
jgi:RNA polymerase sigma-70 factor (ECF subfamily)